MKRREFLTKAAMAVPAVAAASAMAKGTAPEATCTITKVCDVVPITCSWWTVISQDRPDATITGVDFLMGNEAVDASGRCYRIDKKKKHLVYYGTRKELRVSASDPSAYWRIFLT